MKIKRFIAKDMKTALTEVKAVLGPDAVIMSNTKTADGVEIVAAVDNDAKTPAPQPEQTPPTQNRFQQRYVQPNQAAAPNRADPVQSYESQRAQEPPAHSEEEMGWKDELGREQVADSLKALLQQQKEKRENFAAQKAAGLKPNRAPQESDSFGQSSQAESLAAFASAGKSQTHSPSGQPLTSELDAMKSEMTELRKLLEHQVSGLMWQEMARREPIRAFLVDRLGKMGIANEVADQVASFIPEDLSQHEAWKHALELLAGQVNVTNDDILRRGGVVSLVGPTGVGKTTTVAKLAAHFAKKYGSDSVAMISTDTYRIGAHEQLMTYAKILGCPCKVAKDEHELAEYLHQMRNRKLIVIDTAGVGQRDQRLAEQLDNLMRSSRIKIRHYLVLQSTSQRRVLEESISQFKRIPITGCIFTKIDECISLGEIISVAIQNALPIGYLTEGQSVPEDIIAATAEYLIERATRLLKERNISQPDWFTEDSRQPIYK